MKLSIVIPVYNEQETLREILGQVRAVELPGIEKEILVVDDGSTDGSSEILADEAVAGDLRAPVLHVWVLVTASMCWACCV